VDVGSPEAGFFRNAATKQCLNVAGCSNPVIFDGCSAAPTQTCGGAGLKGQPNEQFTLNGTRVLSALQPVPDGDRQRRPGPTPLSWASPGPLRRMDQRGSNGCHQVGATH
jgi:hypothetical protein